MTTPDPSRAAFEQWYIEDAQSLNISLRDWTRDELMRAYLERRQSGLYRSESANSEWKVWQAAMAHKGAECWQPIETAPKDGTNFLALIGDQPYEARFDERGRVVRFIHTNFDCKPTHWAPLPAAPKQEGSS